METEFTKDYKDTKERYTAFIKDLEAISKKHNVVLSVTGGVILYPNSAKLDNLTYTDDYLSGDITPQFLFKKDDHMANLEYMGRIYKNVSGGR